MKPIAEHLENLPSTLPRAEPGPSSSAPARAEPLDQGTLVDLWLANTAAYGPKWTSRAGDLPIDEDANLTIAGGVWARGLAGLSRAAVLGALERHARVSAWPAELAELRALAMGIPSMAEVKLLLHRDEPVKPPFVVLIFQHLDFYAWRMADQRSADRMLADAYAVARDHVLLGGELPTVRGQLEAPESRKPVPASPAVARRYIDEVYRIFRVQPPQDEDQATRAQRGKDAAAGPDV